MKVRVLVLIFFFLAFFVKADQILFQREEYPPAPTGYMNDFGNFLSVEERKEMEDELRNFQYNHGLRIVVITVSLLNGKTGIGYLDGYARKRKLQDKQNIILLFSHIGPKEGTAAIITGGTPDIWRILRPIVDLRIQDNLEREDFKLSRTILRLTLRRAKPIEPLSRVLRA